MAQADRETLTDPLDAARAEALHAVLGLDRPAAPLIPYAHQVYFWQPRKAGRLGDDGHPRPGDGLIPDMGLPRRMWAGGRLEFHAPLRPGKLAKKRSQRIAAKRKTGRTGALGLVTLRHEISQDGQLCVVEEQDLIYRDAAAPGSPAPVPPRAPQDADESRSAGFSTTMLFRYSALTFNGHRIHYDADYARDVEGYAGLVVHGPLLAQLLMLMAEESQGRLSRFDFRATAPLFHFEEARLCRRGTSMWVAGPDGRQCMEAEAQA